MEHYEVIVAGGGPSGVAAAVAAARNGCKTLLIERDGYLGGMATSALVPAFGPFTNGETDLIGGIGREILERLKRECYQSPFYDRKPDRIEGIDWHPIDSEILKRVLDEIVEKSGCETLFYTSVIDASCENGQITKLTISNKSGIQSVSGDYVVDCTGDADVAAMAGAEFSYGDEQGLVQAATLCFKVAGIDVKRFMEYVEKTGENGNLSLATERARAEGKFPEGETKIGGMALQADGVAGLNFGHVYRIRPLDGADLSRAEMEARRKLPELVEFLRAYVPGMERAVLAASGPRLGIRESRRIHGKYTLTYQDYIDRAKHEDDIAYYSYPIDLHAAVPDEGEEKENLYQNSRYANGESYGIPYRCLIPEGFTNLAVAGRTISADRSVMASIRIMSPCFATGQAAGTAAALCVKLCRESGGKQSLPSLDVKTLQAELKKQGACMHQVLK